MWKQNVIEIHNIAPLCFAFYLMMVEYVLSILANPINLYSVNFLIQGCISKSKGFSSGAMMGNNEDIKGDKLVLRGLKFHGFHGVKPEERNLGQKFLVDIDAWTDLQAAGKSDCLSDTVSYSDIYR